MEVPFIDLCRGAEELNQRFLDEIGCLIGNAGFIGGPHVDRLEALLAERLSVRYAITCANGTDALQLALRACGVGTGDQVLIPNLTFWATFEAVVNVGATPVTVDIDLDDAGLDLEALSDAFEVRKPKAVIAAHLYGWASARLADIREICADKGVILIEDSAQAFGVEFHEAPIFQEAQISTTSFYPAKVLGAAGDGGAVLTNDQELAGRVRTLANHGRSAHYLHADCGWNSRMDAIQALYLVKSMEVIDEKLASRRVAASYYRSNLSVSGMTVMAPPSAFLENGYCNVCLAQDPSFREVLIKTLSDASIGFGRIYPGTITSQPAAERLVGGHHGGSNAEKFCSRVLNLPLFPFMKQEELNYVADKMNTVASVAGT